MISAAIVNPATKINRPAKSRFFVMIGNHDFPLLRRRGDLPRFGGVALGSSGGGGGGQAAWARRWTPATPVAHSVRKTRPVFNSMTVSESGWRIDDQNRFH